MGVDGIRSFYIETHNFGKAATFWKSLGFSQFLDLGGTSGGFRAADGGAFLFIEEVGEDHPLAFEPYFNVVDVGAVPTEVIVTPPESTHWGSTVMEVCDPDGRVWKLEDAGQRFPDYK